MYPPPLVSSSLGSQRSTVPGPQDYTATLIISFPAKYPAVGTPSYAIRGSGVSSSDGHVPVVSETTLYMHHTALHCIAVNCIALHCNGVTHILTIFSL